MEAANCTRIHVEAGLCSEFSRIYNISRIIPHPDFDPITYLNDIGLIKLADEVEFGEFVEPVCIPDFGDITVLSTTPIRIAGFGLTSPNAETGPDVRQVANVTLFDEQLCRLKFKKKKQKVTKRMFCAGGIKGIDACTGDSGCPAMVYENGRWYVAGIVTFGKNCGQEGWPGVYTKVMYYYDWIKIILSKNL